MGRFISKKRAVREIMNITKNRWIPGDRTFDYYVRLKMLPKPKRPPGMKTVYWERDELMPRLFIIYFLKRIGLSLKQIVVFMKRINEYLKEVSQ